MPSANVLWPVPLTRLNPWFPGQMGVPGTDNETGLRLSCTGTVFYVDPNFPGVSNLRDGTDPEHPLASVATALTKCQPYRGDVIAVMANNAWQYGNPADLYVTAIAEEVVVTVPGVKIVGLSPASSLGVYWYPATSGGTCITVGAIDVTIEGFCFGEGGATGCNAIYAQYGGSYYGDNLTVRHCYFDDTVDIAIEMDFSWYCDIHNNVFLACDEYGIYVDAASGAILYSRIHDNIFHNVGLAAMAFPGGCDDSYIYRNQIYNANAQGGIAATDEGIATTGGDNNMVCDNYFSCLLPTGVPLSGDWNDFCSSVATDAWINNHLLNGDNTTRPT